ncbi:cupin domain-containing protein [Dactylosporangium aurantiacum]|uniref:Cupin domain-containing protein n=1 Tax=Dactylosporangium aurantiacum TaxID=35754 RepID=A0A9Q9ME41_9ACTN|nr:cupin domain-containing protein [Dactylosporangium aurantiacum]MDG6102954.1 cupin domain-containing protein [Dactylosporangium aurantiacum]UWZ52824.1 cupin domain-containing protein [Dactylosporangium aurantiacum]
MQVVRTPSQGRQAPQQCYSGVVWIDRDVTGLEPSRLQTFHAQFSPGTRTAWHRCRYGQVLTVLHGVGRVQRRGGPIHEVRAGDTVVVEAGEWHWHGAAPNTFMVVMSAHETGPDGTGTEWGEHVSDAEYRLPPITATIRRPDADRTPQREACW